MVLLLISTHLIRKDNKLVVYPQVIFFLLKGCGMHGRQYTYSALNQGITLQMAGNLNCFPPSFSGALNHVKNTFLPGSFTRIFFLQATLTLNSHHLHMISCHHLHKIPPHQASPLSPPFKVQSFILQLCSATFIEL